MAIILAIETSTKNCSVALFKDSNLLSFMQSDKQEFVHSEQLTNYIQNIVALSKINLKDIDAIALSKGPGSYTGLRIGTSTAKGLCFALEIPLISVSTLQAMAFSMKQNSSVDLYCPMIDARRDEVFCALYDNQNKEIRRVQADIVDASTYTSFLDKKILFFGNGALKCKEILCHKNAIFVNHDIYPCAKNLGVLSYMKYCSKEFEDTAYFEPYYLKDFILGNKK